MNWESSNKDLKIYQTYEHLIRLRNTSDPMKFGTLLIPFIDEARQIMVVERRHKEKAVYAICNFSDEEQTADLGFILPGRNISSRSTDSNIIIEANYFVTIAEG